MSKPSDSESMTSDESSEYGSDNECEEIEGGNHLENSSIHNEATGTRNNGIWENMFQRLVDFREKHGHCRVPYRYKEDPPLGMWVAVQRRQYKLLHSGRCKKTPLTPERESRLKKIGFEWTAESRRWESRFGDLLEFVTINGHAQVPTKWKENSKLSSWVSAQRREYKNLKMGRPSALTQGRVQLLNSVGFVWQAERGGTKRLWEGKIVPVSHGSKAANNSPMSRAVAEKLLGVLNGKKGERGNSKSKSSKKKETSDDRSKGIAAVGTTEAIDSFGLKDLTFNGQRRASLLGDVSTAAIGSHSLKPPATSSLPALNPLLSMDIAAAERSFLQHQQSLYDARQKLAFSSFPAAAAATNPFGIGDILPIRSQSAALQQSFNDMTQRSKMDISERLRSQSLLLDDNLIPPSLKLQNLMRFQQNLGSDYYLA